jgi:peroxiredoxin
MKKILFLFVFFIQIVGVFGQKDTIVFHVYKGIGVRNEGILKTPYRVFLNAAGPTGEPVLAYLDTASIKTQSDSLRAEKRVKTYFSSAQKVYFNMIYKPIENFEGVDFEDKMLNISDFYGKKTIIYFFDASSQPSFEKIETMNRLYEKYASLGYKFLIVSQNLRSELMRYNVLQNLPYPILAEQKQVIGAYSKNLTCPFISIVDEKGIVQKVFLFSSLNYNVAFEDDELETANITDKTSKEEIQKLFEQINKNSIWVEVKNKEKELKDKDYLWNLVVEYLGK